MRVEIRSDHVLLDGYVNAVGRDSRVIPDRRGGFVEQVTPGAFAKALGRGRPVELKLNHERVIGSTATGEIELREDNIGLRAIAKITDAAVIEKARKKQLRGWSFGFRKPVDRWEERTGEPPRRYLDDLDLREVTLVDETKIPAYPATSVELRDGSENEITEYRVSDDVPEYSDSVSPEPDQKPKPDPQPPEPKRADTKTLLAGYRARRLKL